MGGIKHMKENIHINKLHAYMEEGERKMAVTSV